MKDSELRYRRLFETAQDGILIIDADTGHITDVNPFLVNLLGYSREDFIDQTLWHFSPFKDTQQLLNHALIAAGLCTRMREN